MAAVPGSLTQMIFTQFGPTADIELRRAGSALDIFIKPGFDPMMHSLF
jgi:hypothetical protein